jgi:hypothetical protein
MSNYLVFHDDEDGLKPDPEVIKTILVSGFTIDSMDDD